jgi:YegS/Rv2252/BmrU family lipid kinase
MKKMLFIYNPHSGKGLIRNHLFQIIDIFSKGGYDVTVHPTQAKLDAFRTVTESGEDYDVIVTSGGDGTLNETIKGLMQLDRKIPLGYIPAGTMNDFASSLGIPKNMPKAAEKIIADEKALVDIGAFNEEFFTYVAGFGAFTDVSYETSQQMKNMFGSMAYIAEALKLKRLGNTKSYHMQITYDGFTFEDDFIYGMMCNSTSVGGFKGLAGENVLLNDGILEGLFIKMPQSLTELQQIINALLARELDSGYFYSFKTGSVKVHSDTEIPWTLDGEFGGNLTDVSIKAVKEAVCIFTSPDSKILGGTNDVESDEARQEIEYDEYTAKGYEPLE